jgi:hypothetical protein
MDTKQQETSAEVDERYPNTPIGIVRSRDAFLRDLPALLANPKYDRWCVAYCGDVRIGIAEFEVELVRECQRRGLHCDQYFIGCIFPHGENDEEIETGFYEFDEVVADANAAPNATEPIA